MFSNRKKRLSGGASVSMVRRANERTGTARNPAGFALYKSNRNGGNRAGRPTSWTGKTTRGPRAPKIVGIP